MQQLRTNFNSSKLMMNKEATDISFYSFLSLTHKENKVILLVHVYLYIHPPYLRHSETEY